MRSLVVVAILVLSAVCCGVSFGQNTFRIQRNDPNAVIDNTEQSVPQYATKNRPLTGGVHRAPLVDPSDFGNANINPLRGMTSKTPMEPNLDMMKIQAPLRVGRQPGDVPDQDLNLLKSRDIVIMQDRSSSMGEHENFPQGYFPRWYWCLSQAMDFRRQTLRLPSWAFTLVLFSSQFDVYRNVHMEDLPNIYDRNHIWIGTKLAQPMEQQIVEYFQRRAQGRARPLEIAVVTDGKPKDEGRLADVIIEATQHLQSPREVHITFLQVGTDDESQRKLFRLDQGLVSQGARYDIVSVMPFARVTQLGLTRALITAIKEAH